MNLRKNKKEVIIPFNEAQKELKNHFYKMSILLGMVSGIFGIIAFKSRNFKMILFMICAVLLCASMVRTLWSDIVFARIEMVEGVIVDKALSGYRKQYTDVWVQDLEDKVYHLKIQSRIITAKNYSVGNKLRFFTYKKYLEEEIDGEYVVNFPIIQKLVSKKKEIRKE